MAQCAVHGCRSEQVMTYYWNPVCLYHWERHCDDGARFSLKVEFGIEDELKPGARAFLAKRRAAKKDRVRRLLERRRRPE